MTTQNLIIVVFVGLMVPGVFLALVPMMPALLYMFLLAALYGFLNGFVSLTAGNLAVLGGIFAASVIIDYSAGVIGARYGGASRKSIFWGFVGMLAGLLVLPPFGGFLGLFTGVFISELIRRKNKNKAMKAATASLVGSVAGMVVNVVLAIAFLTLFIIFVL